MLISRNYYIKMKKKNQHYGSLFNENENYNLKYFKTYQHSDRHCNFRVIPLANIFSEHDTDLISKLILKIKIKFYVTK